MLHAVYVDAVVLVLALVVNAAPIDVGLSRQALATRIHLFVFVGATLSLVISAAVSRVRRQAESLAEAERAARQDADRLATVTRTVPDGLAIVHRDGRVEPLNDSSPGFLERDADGRVSLPTRISAADGSDLDGAERPSAIALAGSPSRDVPVAVDAPDGIRRIFDVSSNPLSAEFGDAVLLSFGDATERHLAIEERTRAQEDLAYRARHDSLTGLRNRAGFADALAALEERRRGDGEDAGVLVLDPDRFKAVNDTLGHAAGDELLVEVARAITTITRPGDITARLGGDEFAVLLPGVTLALARRVGERLIAEILRTTSRMAGEQRRVTASVGAATLALADRMGLAPMALADMLVYEAKAGGRNSLAAVDPANPTLPRMGRDLAAADRIRSALADGGLVLHLQPIADVRTGRIRAAEALLRLDDGGPALTPGEFMPVVERVGLAPEVDAWVFREALAVRRLLDESAPDLVLSVNVSGPSVGHPAYRAALDEALGHAGPEAALRPRSVVLEVTETSAVADMDAAAAFTRWARGRGLGVSLDDFGAGFGPFTYVKRLEFDVVKIDGSFMRRTGLDPTDRSIVSAIATLAHDLGKTTIGEYVENADAWRAARELGVDYVQGAAVGDPVPVEEFLGRYAGGGGDAPDRADLPDGPVLLEASGASDASDLPDSSDSSDLPDSSDNPARQETT